MHQLHHTKTPNDQSTTIAPRKTRRLPWETPCIVDLGVEGTENGEGYGNEDTRNDPNGSFFDS